MVITNYNWINFSGWKWITLYLLVFSKSFIRHVHLDNTSNASSKL